MRYIALDVDGVLNSMQPTDHSFSTFGYVNGSKYRLNLDKRHAQWLTDLAKEHDATLIWGTTWGELANTQIGPKIGLPHLDCPDFGPQKFSQSNAAWKYNGVLKYTGDNPCVWLDDDPDIGSLSRGTRLRHIQVNPDKGLTGSDIDRAANVLKLMKEGTDDV